MTSRTFRLCALIIYALCLTSPGTAQQNSAGARSTAPLTNQDIVLMTRSKFDDATIVKTIQSFNTNFDLSVAALMKLKDAGVTQTVIQAMLAKTTDGSKTLPPEHSGFKGHVNGSISGAHSNLKLASPRYMSPDVLEFYVHCAEGGSATEYQLLHFWEKGDRREFRAVTGGVLHAAGGAKDNVVSFEYEKVAPRIYKITVPRLGVGEYGFLAPGAVASANAASQGKIYTFQIVE